MAQTSSMMDSWQCHVLIVLVGLLWQGRLVNAGSCQAPAGYTLETSVDKYYKPVRNRVTWQSARAACSSDGTILVELRSAADYQVIRHIYGKVMLIFKFNQGNL